MASLKRRYLGNGMADQAEKLRNIVQKINEQKAERRGARIIAITSGKGGVGKTSFAVNFAFALAEMGKRVAIIDADFGFSNVDILLGASTRYDLGHVIRGERSLEESVAICENGVKFISGGSGVEDLLNIEEDKIAIIVDQLKALEEQNDYIIFDTGAGMQKPTLRLLQASDDTILILTPEPTSIMDAYVILKTLAAHVQRPNISLVVNRVSSESEAELTCRNFKLVVKKFLEYHLATLGYIYTDSAMTKSIAAFKPLMQKFPDSMCAKQFRDVAKKYIAEEECSFKPGGLKGFFGKLFSKNAAF